MTDFHTKLLKAEREINQLQQEGGEEFKCYTSLANDDGYVAIKLAAIPHSTERMETQK